MKILVIDYFDVWGNKIDGYDINDQAQLGFFEIDNLEDKTIMQFLHDNNLLSPKANFRNIYLEDWGTCLEVFEKKTQKPLYGIRYDF